MEGEVLGGIGETGSAVLEVVGTRVHGSALLKLLFIITH